MVFNGLKYYFINSNLALIIYIYIFFNEKFNHLINDENRKSTHF